MSYYLRVYSSSVTIDPPLNYEEIQKISQAQEKDNGYSTFVIDIQSEIEEVSPVGKLEIITAPALQVNDRIISELRDFIKRDLQLILDCIEPGHKFIGEFKFRGEDFTDIRRVQIDEDYNIHIEAPKLVWSDSETESFDVEKTARV